MSTLKTKLNPARFPGMSLRMAAIVGFVLQEAFASPEIEHISINENEDRVYLRAKGEAGFGDIQNLADLRNNWNRLMDAAGLTADERKDAVRLFHLRVEKAAGTEVG